MKPEETREILRKAIQDLTDRKEQVLKDPQRDFSRYRKLSFDQMITAIMGMGSGSLANEMMDVFGFDKNLATTSAFIQQRAKILPEAFERLFRLFVENTS